MDNTVVVRIPKTKNYTLYAEGSLCRIDKDGEDHLITLDFSHPVLYVPLPQKAVCHNKSRNAGFEK